MKIDLELGDKHGAKLRIQRNWFTGKFTYEFNGERHNIRCPANLATHFNFDFEKTYRFVVGHEEKYNIAIIHKRPFFFAGFRPQEFNIFVNGKLHHTYKGY